MTQPASTHAGLGRQVDLHVHSHCSDGTCSPTELVDYAMEKGLLAIALTDHDTVDGLSEAIAYADERRRHVEALAQEGEALHVPRVPEVVPGIEFSTEYERQDIHIVGLFIDWETPGFRNALNGFVDSRINRNFKMCQNLRDAGIDISFEGLQEKHPGSVITRAHYAAWLLEKGYVKSQQDAFSQYLGDHTKYFVPREKVTPAQAVDLVLQAGGVPILAHPTLYRMGKDRLYTLTASLTEAGLMGIEAFYSSYSRQDERDMMRLAERFGLLLSGGSDFHGANKPGLDLGCGYGNLFVPEELLEKIKKARRP